MSIIFMFENRYFVLFGQNSFWKYLRYPFLILNFFIGLITFVPTFLTVPQDHENARRQLFNLYPNACEYVPDKSLIFVINFYEKGWVKLAGNLTTYVLFVEIIVFVVALKVKLNRISKASMSSVTLRMQKKFIKALNLQV